MTRSRTLTLTCAALIAAAAATTIGQAPAPPRGASGPPEHAKVTPINNLPNPYETVRSWGALAGWAEVGIGERGER